MTSPEKIEELLNRFGQTISDLPEVKDFKNYGERDELLNRMLSAEKSVEEWFDPDSTDEYYDEALPASVCHQSDVIERLIKALETAEKIVSCEYCVKHESKCGNCSGYECTGFQMMDMEQIKKDMEARL